MENLTSGGAGLSSSAKCVRWLHSQMVVSAVESLLLSQPFTAQCPDIRRAPSGL